MEVGQKKSAAKGMQKHFYDKKAKNRKFQVGQKVLVLLPTEHNKLTLQRKGLYKLVEVVNRIDYNVRVYGNTKVHYSKVGLWQVLLS